jgi:hypothetical protein
MTRILAVFGIGAMLAAGIPSMLSAEEVTPARNKSTIYNKVDGGGDSVTTWLGFAASSNGRVFQNIDRSDEAIARNAARSECEQTTGRTCQAIAVPISWQVAAVPPVGEPKPSLRSSEARPKMPRNG